MTLTLLNVPPALPILGRKTPALEQQRDQTCQWRLGRHCALQDGVGGTAISPVTVSPLQGWDMRDASRV